MWNVRKTPWWNAPADRIREAYYMTMRVHYEMSALKAWTETKRMFAKYPEFMNAPIATLRTAVRRFR